MSSLMVREKIRDAYKALFEVLAKRKVQKHLFGWMDSELIACESSGGNFEPPQFFHYRQKSHHMMERMGYDFTKKLGLNFDKGKRALFRSFVPKGKDPDYYHNIRKELCYVSTPISSDSKSEEEIYHDSSSATSSWDSDVSIVDIFESL